MWRFAICCLFVVLLVLKNKLPDSSLIFSGIFKFLDFTWYLRQHSNSLIFVLQFSLIFSWSGDLQYDKLLLIVCHIHKLWYICVCYVISIYYTAQALIDPPYLRSLAWDEDTAVLVSGHARPFSGQFEQISHNGQKVSLFVGIFWEIMINIFA